MDIFFTLALTAYMMSVVMGLITAGKKGFQKVNRWWYKAITGTIGWFFSQVGDLLKFIGKKISS